MADLSAYNPWAAPVFPNRDDNAMQPETYSNPLAQGLLSQLAGAIGRGFMAPGQALASTTPITSGQMVAPAMDMAGMTTLGAGAVPQEANTLNMGIKAYHGSPLAIKDAVEAPAVADDMVRLYRGGGNNQGGPKWVTTNRKYAEGYTTPGLAHSPGAGSYLQYADIPATDARVQMPAGQSVHSFEAPGDIADQLKPFYRPKQ